LVLSKPFSDLNFAFFFFHFYVCVSLGVGIDLDEDFAPVIVASGIIQKDASEITLRGGTWLAHRNRRREESCLFTATTIQSHNHNLIFPLCHFPAQLINTIRT
jgi:hypothetical protein